MEGPKIGIGVTTRNRRDVLEETIEYWVEFLPKGARLVVVDDASDDPYMWCDHRFEEQQGIAGAKNACLSLLRDCEHIFLADDDVRPRKKGWHLPYIKSGLNHMCLSFEKNARGQRLSHNVFVKEEFTKGGTTYEEYNAPNGCLLYIRKKVLEVVGGMDPKFGTWGYEHVEWSERIHNAGLTERPFVDVKDSLEYVTPLDYFGSVESSVPVEERLSHIEVNKNLLEELKGSKRFVEYRL